MGEAESIVLLIFAIWRCLNHRWMRGGGVRQKYDCTTGYFYVLFLWTIDVSDFRPLEIYKNLDLSLSLITFTIKTHADNHFYKYIYLFQILYSVKSAFFIKIHVRFCRRFFIFKFDLNVKYRSYFFLQEQSSIEKNSLKKKISFFAVDYVKIIELHIVHTWRHM